MIKIEHRIPVPNDGVDELWIHHAEIADPENNRDAEQLDDGSWVFKLLVPASDDTVPYLETLARVGVTVTHEGVSHGAGVAWFGEQAAPLPELV